MRIAIDATIIRKEITGTGFYIINLIDGLRKIDNYNEYYIYGNKWILNDFIKVEEKNFHIIHKNFKNRIFRIVWQFLIFPFHLKKIKINVLHSPNYITPLMKLGFKVIVTIHDLTFFLFPQKYTVMKRLFYKFMVPIFIRISDKVIAVSNNTKNDILDIFKLPEKKIVVTYESYPKYYNNNKDTKVSKKVMKKYGINREFILYVGMIEPRKNIISLLKAFVELDSELDLDLVIVGKKGWYYREIELFVNNIKGINLKNKMIFTGYVPETELKYFYQSAFIFAYPTFYEGFGLPPLQAMACGTPVITSNTSSLPEVVNKSAIKINPNSIKELIGAIRLLYNNSVKREELIEKGLDQIKKFSLTNIAKCNLETYKSLV